ncbi:FliM/FliN family flagellar motor switch protein [Novosphingobium sp.]|uniref:FliM/FliN family flagellar motor switch protein n=1 Tax=Novosphingobium sp. TaxID=1874826 RepID=UPI0031D1BAA2
MKPERAFIAERTLAQHAPELLRQGPGAAELLPLLNRLGDRMARRMAAALAPLLGGEAPLVKATSAKEGDLSTLHGSIATLAANSIFAVGGNAPLFVSVEAEPVLRIVDRAFGGKGEAPAPLPETFPMAAELMIGRMETLIADHLSAALTATAGRAPGMPVPSIVPQRRDGNLAMLAPFPEDQTLAIVTLEVDDGGTLPWLITVAMPIGTLARLFGFAEGSEVLSIGRVHPVGSPSDAPFSDLPIEVRAIVVDMRISFSTIANLAPGDVLPVSVARAVPLRVGNATFAQGTIGAVDERVAVQITKAFDDTI